MLPLLAILAAAAPPTPAPPTPAPAPAEACAESVGSECADEGQGAGGLEVRLGASALVGEEGALGALDLAVRTESDAAGQVHVRVDDAGTPLVRAGGAVDVLGRGHATLALGAFGGATVPWQGEPEPQVGGSLAVGWTADGASVEGRLRPVLSGAKLGVLTLEQEVEVGLRLGGGLWLTGTWLRVGTGAAAVDRGGAGLAWTF